MGRFKVKIEAEGNFKTPDNAKWLGPLAFVLLAALLILSLLKFGPAILVWP